MNNIIISLCMVCFFVNLQAQSEEDLTEMAPKHIEWSFNTTYLLQNLIGTYAPEEGGLGYLLQRKSFRHPKVIHRMGVGLRFASKIINDVSINRNTTDLGVRFRYGLEKRWTVSPRFQLLVAGDAFVEYAYAISKTNNSFGNNSDTREHKPTFGLAPVFGLDYKITERVHITLESSSSLSFTYTTSKTTISNLQPIKISSQETTFLYDQPLNLFVGIRF